MSVPAHSYTYRFRPNGVTRAITRSSSSVIMQNQNGAHKQNWCFLSKKLYTEEGADRTKCLECTGAGNAQLATASTSRDTYQQIQFIDMGDHLCQIRTYNKIGGNYYYLRAGSNGSSCTWVTSDYTTWEFEFLYRVTDMPCNTTFYPNYVEFFHKDSGIVSGSWPDIGTSKQKYIKNFYNAVFGVDPASNEKYLYNLYGALLFNNANANINGKFHTGVDMNYGTDTSTREIKAPFTGQIIRSALSDYGIVALYNQAQNKTFIFLHMKNLAATGNITKGSKLGDMWGTGSGGSDVFPHHLHVEVHSGRVTAYAPYASSGNDSLGNLMPYNSLYDCLSWG